MGGPEVERLIALLAKLPGLGPRSARRAALRLLQHPETRLVPLAAAMAEAARAVRVCSRCGNLDSADPCSICTDPHRDRATICVVEGVGDLWALERAGVHRGLYHVLGGILSPLDGIGPEQLNIATLHDRVKDNDVTELIMALSPTIEGDTTVYYIARQLKGLPVTITTIARGISFGGELEYADEMTLARSIAKRLPIENYVTIQGK